MSSSTSSSPSVETATGKNFSFELITAENVISSDSKTASFMTFSASTTPPAYRHNQSPRDPAIRHAGRAHIRGKIRRIWRPRYLELCDKGLLRYYELPPTADVTMPEEADWQHVNMVIKDTLVIHHSRIVDVTTLRDLHVGLPRGSYGFLFRGQRLYVNELLLKKPQEPEAPREYFCAVSTLEEAQTWVIALQWAAAMCRKNQIAGTIYYDHESGFRSSSDTILTKNTRKGGISLQCGMSNSSSTVPSSLGGRSVDKSGTKSPLPKKSSKPERVLVTKVHGFRVIRDITAAPAFRWEVAYEVALLLVQKHKVEERRILLTARELEEMLCDLCACNQDSLLQSFYEQLKDQAGSLPRFHASKQNACNPKSVADSVMTIDSILRSLAMQPSAVNSRSVKQTLGLDVEQPAVKEVSWWKLPGRSNGSGYKGFCYDRVVFRQVRPIPNDVTVDEWVRVWLVQTSKNCQMQQATSSSWQMQTQFLVLRRPWFLMSGVGVAAALMYPVTQAYQRSIISFSMRADLLAASWCFAYWVGRRKGIEQAKQQRVAALQATARGIPRISTISPPIESTPIASPHRSGSSGLPMSPVVSAEEDLHMEDSEDSAIDGEDVDSVGEDVVTDEDFNIGKLSSPLPLFCENGEGTGWSEPPDPSIFRVRGSSYLEDRIKVPSGPSPFKCRGVDVWMTDNPERHIARHPSVLGGKLKEEHTFLVNFLLPFANFVSYFTVPPIEDFPNKQVADVWTKFINGDQQYRDARLKLLPVVVEGPWIVKAAVGNGSAPALLGKAIPLQYFFQQPDGKRKGVYEVDVIITASTIAKSILTVVKGHTNSLSIAFALIIEASKKEELPETVLCSFQVHFLDLEDCPMLPDCNLDDIKE
ncbi:DUF1336 domain containing protein [Nitzschia inconspicua]|uniref:DUF1336 domain containing protein n=1 Tax=Nitzschia inconspicua TaxID=303405 RepID=A0A9K3KS16_9STRA|nr:DUF1336 domain containing protein [Nitzschia inconspicua]